MLNAAAKGDTATVLQLIADGVEIDLTNEKGWTPLVVAAFNQHMDTVKALIDAGAEVNHQSISGTTVFAQRPKYWRQEIIFSGLLTPSRSRNKYKRFQKRGTVLQYVQDIGHTEMERYLISKGAVI